MKSTESKFTAFFVIAAALSSLALLILPTENKFSYPSYCAGAALGFALQRLTYIFFIQKDKAKEYKKGCCPHSMSKRWNRR